MPLQYVMAAGDVPGGTGGGGGGGAGSYGGYGSAVEGAGARRGIFRGRFIQIFGRNRAGRRAALQGY